ncbi:MAG: hypothetical protein GY730_06185 [bacterium]|nr:hypothetical protein [bacterium]
MLFEKLARQGADFLGVKYPIICGAMTWVSDFDLVKAVSKNGAFPVLAGGNMTPEFFEKEVDRCIEEIKLPFAVNLITIAPNYKVQLEILQTKKVPFIVFAGSFPKKTDIEKMKNTGKKTMSFASDKRIAAQQIRFGIDSLILEGSEAGGHIGQVSLIVLLQQVLFDFREVPIFVGGGVATGKMIAHLLSMGAAGCQLGTRFVMTDECNAHDKFKQAFIKARARHAVATPQYDSKLPVVAVRALKNKGMEEFGRLQLQLIKELGAKKISREKAQFEVERFWIGALRNAVIDGDIDEGSLMAGQSVGLMDEVLPMKAVINNLVEEACTELERIKDSLK